MISRVTFCMKAALTTNRRFSSFSPRVRSALSEARCLEIQHRRSSRDSDNAAAGVSFFSSLSWMPLDSW